MKHLFLLISLLLSLSLCGADVVSVPLEKVHHKLTHTREFIGDNLIRRIQPKSKRGDIALTTDGYAFVAPVTIGTPAKNFKLHVDTGSTLTAVPIQGCTRCDTEIPDTPYNPLASSTSAAISCTSSQCTQRSCSIYQPASCSFNVTYEVGAIAGTLYTDKFTLGGYTATVDIGAISQSSANFEQPAADGIMGFAYNNQYYTCLPNCITPVYDALLNADASLSNVFAMIFGDTSGTLTIGGIDPLLVAGDIHYTPVVQEGLYVVQLNTISINGYSLYSEATNVVVDSGTSYLLVPAQVYNDFQNYIQTHFSNIPGVTGKENIFSSNICYTTNKYVSMFPDMTMAFDGVQITLPPSSYIIEISYNGTSEWCLALRASDGILLGTPIFRNNYVIFDRENKRIGFSQSKTAATSSSPHLTPVCYAVVTLFFIAVIANF